MRCMYTCIYIYKPAPSHLKSCTTAWPRDYCAHHDHHCGDDIQHQQEDGTGLARTRLARRNLRYAMLQMVSWWSFYLYTMRPYETIDWWLMIPWWELMIIYNLFVVSWWLMIDFGASIHLLFGASWFYNPSCVMMQEESMMQKESCRDAPWVKMEPQRVASLWVNAHHHGSTHGASLVTIPSTTFCSRCPCSNFAGFHWRWFFGKPFSPLPFPKRHMETQVLRGGPSSSLHIIQISCEFPAKASSIRSPHCWLPHHSWLHVLGASSQYSVDLLISPSSEETSQSQYCNHQWRGSNVQSTTIRIYSNNGWLVHSLGYHNSL